MSQFQKFGIAAQGIVQSGLAHYDLDFDTGFIEYQATVQIGFLFVTKTYNKAGSFQANPSDFLSENLKTIGRKFSYDNVRFEVLAVKGTKTQVNVTVTGQRMSGFATFDTSKEIARLDSLYAKATVSGVTVNLGMTEIA